MRTIIYLGLFLGPLLMEAPTWGEAGPSTSSCLLDLSLRVQVPNYRVYSQNHCFDSQYRNHVCIYIYICMYIYIYMCIYIYIHNIDTPYIWVLWTLSVAKQTDPIWQTRHGMVLGANSIIAQHSGLDTDSLGYVRISVQYYNNKSLQKGRLAAGGGPHSGYLTESLEGLP